MKKRYTAILSILLVMTYLAAASAKAHGAAPANDSFANAAEINTISGSILGLNIDATKEPGEPNHAGNAGGKSVWFKYTYPSFLEFTTGYTFTLRFATTNFDTLLAVYTGTSVNNLTLLASNDDYGSTPSLLTSTVFLPVVPGQTYYIAVDGFGGASGNFFLSSDPNETHIASSRFAGTTDGQVSVFRPSNGTWYVDQASGADPTFKWGVNGDIPVPADYDGDRVTDYAVYRPSTGTWYVLESRVGSIRAVKFGLTGDKPVPGDFNANGYADLAVFRPGDGVWYVLDLKTNEFNAIHFGQSGDKPVPRDFDMDGKVDRAVFRPSNGTWYILNSRDASVRVQQWGVSEDIPVPSGYGKFGRADIAVWRPSNGTWYIYLSHNNQFRIERFGLGGDIPQPVDYGFNTGLADFAVYRPSTGTWYIQDNHTGERWAFPFGLNGDIPTAMGPPVQQ